MRMCLLCRKKFERIHVHHISYLFDLTIQVCENCHSQIHLTEKYPHLKPIDDRKTGELRHPEIKASILNLIGLNKKRLKCYWCGHIWITNSAKNQVRCPSCNRKVWAIHKIGEGVGYSVLVERDLNFGWFIPIDSGLVRDSLSKGK